MRTKLIVISCIFVLMALGLGMCLIQENFFKSPNRHISSQIKTPKEGSYQDLFLVVY
ncbi:MAG: hypothetical protein H6622_16445 [Halobacteriovoraceae bacterium]|nr:hypothetical protein [Halobacteriovoraceae bacterium]